MIIQPDLNSRTATCPMQKQMKCLVSWVTQDPKFLPTTQCHVGLYFLSNSFLIQAAISFSMLNFSRATLAQSMASCCISQFMSACLITAFLSAVDIIKSIKQSKTIQNIDQQPSYILPILSHFQKSHLELTNTQYRQLRSYNFKSQLFVMMSLQHERRNRPTYIELKNAINMGEKERKLEKLGGAIKASIQKLRTLKTDILSESNVRNLVPLLAEYEKANLYYNELQVSLAQIDEESPLLDRIKQMNKDFINSHQPEQLKKKMEFMRTERSKHVNIENAVEMNFINEQEASGKILAGNKHELRRRMLEEEKQEIDQIEILVRKINKIATDTGNMILDVGMKLNIAANTMSRVKDNLAAGRKDLAEANQYQQDTNKKLISFCLLAVLIISVIVMIFYSSSKKDK